MCGTIQGDLYVQSKRSSISTIRSYLKSQGGPAMGNRYQVLINTPPGLMPIEKKPSNFFNPEALSIMCDTATLPGMGFETGSIPDIGPDYVYPFEATFENFELTFNCSENMQERIFFNNWFLYIHPINDSNFPLYQFRANYVTDMVVTKYNMHDDITYRIKLIEAFPITMPSQELSYEGNDILKLNIEFNYSRWVMMYNDKDEVIPGNTPIST
jgi:hypothetical protein